jgi:hypothetical protein
MTMVFAPTRSHMTADERRTDEDDLPMSSLSWLDYSEHDRRQVLDVIRLFSERDTRDELGIGTIRDAFADILFPGTSTIQTRARYFLLVPWVYRELEGRRIRSAEIEAHARRAELALIGPLTQSADPAGTIGGQAGQTLQRLPSSVYWLGLRRWGIRTYDGSQSQYHRSLDAYYRHSGRGRRNDDGEPVDGRSVGNWHQRLPEPPSGFPTSASFSLSVREAEYLRDRIMLSEPGTLLAFLVDTRQTAEPVPFPWAHPRFGELSPSIQEQLLHARNFAESIHGAALLYEKISEYRLSLQDWAVKLDTRRETFDTWDRRRFWEVVTSDGARVSVQTRLFVDAWLSLATDSTVARAVEANEHVRRLIHNRERLLKHAQARLNNRRALELWGGAAGRDQLTYRWPVAQQLVADIVKGLGREDGRA